MQAGFVLSGGQSSRMGRDKGLLPYGGRTLVEEICRRVAAAAGNVTIIGPAERYGHLAIPVVEDLVPRAGPLGGLYTVLKTTSADWNLVVACDMPGVEIGFLEKILAAARQTDRLAVVPHSSQGWEPLCAVYHRRLLAEVRRALDHKLLKMQDFVASISAEPWPVSNLALLRNINTPEDWQVSV
jgi:molybdopterin-guanine dinucleotide biosynthesis protein A